MVSRPMLPNAGAVGKANMFGTHQGQPFIIPRQENTRNLKSEVPLTQNVDSKRPILTVPGVRAL